MSSKKPRLTDRVNAKIFREGSEPDPQSTLANEQTFLAWTRTALAFLAGGVALEAFPSGRISGESQQAIALLLIIVGLVISIGSAFRWFNIQRALRTRTTVPLPWIVPFLSMASALVCALAIYSFTR